MTVLQWRMPAARLLDVSVAEVAEALDAPLRDQLRVRVDKDVLAVYSLTAHRRAIGILLIRDDDSFVWRVTQAKSMSATEFEAWLGRCDPRGPG